PAQMPQLTHRSGSTSATSEGLSSSRSTIVIACQGQSCGHWLQPVHRRGSTTLADLRRRDSNGTAMRRPKVVTRNNQAPTGDSRSVIGSHHADGMLMAVE